MINYYLNDAKSGPVLVTAKTTTSPVLSIINKNEYLMRAENIPCRKELIHSLNGIKYCKVEVYKDSICGTLRIPQKNKNKEPKLTLGFRIKDKNLLLIEQSGDLKRWIEKHISILNTIQAPDELLLQLLEHIIEDDVMYLTRIEDKLQNMEEQLLNDELDDYYSVMQPYRRKLLEFYAFYDQLTDMGELLQICTHNALIKNADLWGKFTHRTERLQNHATLLRDEIAHLGELYKSGQDEKQNKIMETLTVVTIIFLPLTLLTGWYGMNFEYMLELHYRTGYYRIIILAIIIVVFEIIYFKRKKFF